MVLPFLQGSQRHLQNETAKQSVA